LRSDDFGLMNWYGIEVFGFEANVVFGFEVTFGF
jgi:hypothetical protein